ncbi:MAG: extracellular solute-binding protein [Deltaproteobacteria bacterium]|nr:extracellular solute-binding protein [Deltaproteobacteria bacterium]
MKRTRPRLILLLTVISWIGGLSIGLSQSDHTEKLLQAAKKEAKLVFYTTMAIDNLRPVVDGFTRRYPFINVEFVRLSQTPLVIRLQMEVRAGKWLFDVANMNGIDILSSKNLLSPYVSPEAEFYLREYKDDKSLWSPLHVYHYVMVHNTKMVPREQGPKDYGDLLDPGWRGKMILHSGAYAWHGTLTKIWGSEKAGSYFKNLARQEIQWRGSFGFIARMIAAGEAPLGVAFPFRVEQMKQQGAPLEWVKTFSPTVADISGIGLSAKPMHPNAARLFMDFVLSKTGQEMIVAQGRVSARKDVKPFSPELNAAKLRNVQVVPAEVNINIDRYAREFRDAFGLTSGP